MGPEILFPLLPLCLLHVAWVVLGWAGSRRRWLAVPIAAAIAMPLLYGVRYRVEPALDLVLLAWAAYLLVFLPILLVRGVCYVVRLPKDPPPA